MQSVNLSLCTYPFIVESPSVCEVTLAQVHFLREKVGLKVVAVSCAIWFVDLFFM